MGRWRLKTFVTSSALSRATVGDTFSHSFGAPIFQKVHPNFLPRLSWDRPPSLPRPCPSPHCPPGCRAVYTGHYKDGGGVDADETGQEEDDDSHKKVERGKWLNILKENWKKSKISQKCFSLNGSFLHLIIAIYCAASYFPHSLYFHFISISFGGKFTNFPVFEQPQAFVLNPFNYRDILGPPATASTREHPPPVCLCSKQFQDHKWWWFHDIWCHDTSYSPHSWLVKWFPDHIFARYYFSVMIIIFANMGLLFDAW